MLKLTRDDIIQRLTGAGFVPPKGYKHWEDVPEEEFLKIFTTRFPRYSFIYSATNFPVFNEGVLTDWVDNNDMEDALAENETNNILENGEGLFDILLQGCEGWHNKPLEEVVEWYEHDFGVTIDQTKQTIYYYFADINEEK